MAEIKRYTTPVFRASFPQLAEAKGVDGGEPKFGLSAIWTPSKFTEKEKGLWKTILKALDDESQRCFKKAYKALPGNVKKGLRKGDEKPELGGYGEGTIFANLTTKMRPGVIDRDKNPIAPEDLKEEIYPGCYCRATVTVYSYDNKFGKGLALGLMNLQKVKDGERLDNRTDAAEDFEDDLEDGEEEDNLLDEDEEEAF